MSRGGGGEGGPGSGVALAIETSGSIGSVAVAVDGAVRSRRFLTERAQHGARLVPALASVLEEASLGLDDVTSVVVGSGPGSFTGVRIAAASAKGLAGALDVGLYACSSLVAAAVAPESLAGVSLPEELQEAVGGAWVPVTPVERQRRYVLIDARRGRVYGACVDVGGGQPTELVVPPHGGTVVEVLNRRLPIGTCFAGDGARVHASLIRAAGYTLLPMPAGVATADGLMAVGAWDEVDRHAWEPQYVREWRPGP